MFDGIIDEVLPEYKDTAPEAEAGGPAIWLRVNRIEVAMPWGKPAEQHVGIIINGYEDKDFTRQIEDIVIWIGFGTDEFVKRTAGSLGINGDIPSDGIAQLRQELNIYSLKDLLAKPGVLQGMGALATAFFTVMKNQVYNWSGIDVNTVMSNFKIPTIES